MYKACIFDLDGTLCDSVESIAYSANQAMRDLGLKEAGLEDYKLFVGDGVDMLIRRLLRFAGDREESRFTELKSRYMEYFKEGCMYRVKPYPGILEVLEALKGQGLHLAVLSNKPHSNTRNVIEKVFGTTSFDCILGQSDRFPRKPDPSSARYLAELFDAKPEDCLYVGDTGTDMKTGKSAGMYTVGVLWGFRGRKELEEAGADQVIAHPLELAGISQNRMRRNEAEV